MSTTYAFFFNIRFQKVLKREKNVVWVKFLKGACCNIFSKENFSSQRGKECLKCIWVNCKLKKEQSFKWSSSLN